MNRDFLFALIMIFTSVSVMFSQVDLGVVKFSKDDLDPSNIPKKVGKTLEKGVDITTGAFFGTIETTGSVVGGVVKTGANIVHLDNLLTETGKTFNNVTDFLIIQPTDKVLEETAGFIYNVDAEIKRGIENGTIKYIAIAVASYYLAGPLVFELVGWEQVGGAAILFLTTSGLAGDRKPEKEVQKVISEINKSIEPYIKELTDYLCAFIGKEPGKNCNLNLVFQFNHSEVIHFNLGDEHGAYYDYYKTIYDSSFQFFNEYLLEKQSHDAAIARIRIEKGFEDPVANELIDASNQYFLLMQATSSLLNNTPWSKDSWDDMEIVNLLELYNDANTNYKATQYVFTHDFKSTSNISDLGLRNTIDKWVVENNGELFLNNQLILNHSMEKRNEYTERAPAGAPLVYAMIGPSIVALSFGFKVSSFMEKSAAINKYLEVYESLPLAERTKYYHAARRLRALQYSGLYDLAVEGQKVYPKLFNLIVNPPEGLKSIGVSLTKEVLDIAGSTEFEEKLKELKKHQDDKIQVQE